MKKIFWVLCCTIIYIQLTGCAGWAVRTSSSNQPRVDQEIGGNRGFISGRPTSNVKEPTFTERKVYRIEVEMPQFLPKKKPVSRQRKSTAEAPGEDRVIWGNKGYVSGGPAREVIKETSEAWEFTDASVSDEPATDQSAIEVIEGGEPQIAEPEPKTKKAIEMRTYKVRKGDTLQKISRKFYGTTKKWLLLYKVNKDKLKSPDKLSIGQVLVIPEAAE